MFKNPLINRAFFGAAIISAWGLAGVFICAFLFDSTQHGLITVLGAVSGFGTLGVALFITAAAGRYVLTGTDEHGNEFND